MKMYKILPNNSIKKGNSYIPLDSENSDYQKFIQDVAEQGIEIVEGQDVVEPDYASLRQQEYPSLQEQEDMRYWDEINGTTVWRDTITAVKAKYPKTITGGTTIGEVPDWVQEAASNWTFNRQLREYVDAIERLSQYILSEGRPEICEDIVVETRGVFNEETGEMETIETTEEVITQTAIEPLPATVETTETNIETGETTTATVRNPAIVQDEAERTAAQEIIDATPQAVIDSLS